MMEIFICIGFAMFIALYLFIAHKFNAAKKWDKIARQKIYDFEKYIKGK